MSRFSEREESVRLDVFSTVSEIAMTAVVKAQAGGGGGAQGVELDSILEVDSTSPPRV